MKELLQKICYLGRRSRFDDEIDTEVRFHLETRAAELERSGLSPEAAMAQARREFGSGTRMREETRSAWQMRWLEDLFADLRYAARSFHRNPAFALTAIACLALGIGANTTIFSIGTEVMFSEPSVRDVKSIVHFRIGGSSHIAMSNYRALAATRAFGQIAGENEEVEANWRDGENSSKVYTVQVTDNFFAVTGFPLAIGRSIQPGESDTVVLTHGFWQRRFGGNPSAVGRRLVLDGRPYAVAGILPRDHRTVTGFGFAPDMYVPAATDKSMVALYARLPQGMSRQEARERMKVAALELDRTAPRERSWAQSVEVHGIAGMDRVGFQKLTTMVMFFGVLMAVVGLVLLIACANVASLLLARASSRSHELAVRVSIGAGRGRILRQLLAESLLLSIAGAGAGLALNVAVTSMLSRIQLPLPIPLQFLFQPDWRLMAYASGLAVLTCLAAGTMPALKAARLALAATLKQKDERRWSFRNVLVAGQLAVSIVLLAAGLLFVRNLFEASTVSPGFDTSQTIWSYMRIVPGSNPRPVVAAALDRLRSLPGVESAAVTRWVPLNGNVSNGMDVTTDISPQKVHVQFKFHSVSADYFRTMQIPIVAGREFLATDRVGGPAIGIINESMARRLFGSEGALGHVLHLDGAPVEIVGVAKNSKHFMLTEDNVMAFYEPYYRNDKRIDLHFLIRASGTPEPLLPAITATLGELDRSAAIETKPMSRALTFALLPSRFGAAVLGSMGVLGLLLASIGLYGVLLYSVSRRTREIGLRVALGATPRSVLKLVMGHSAALLGAGLVTGMTLAFFAVQPLAMFLIPGVRPADPLNFLVVGVVLSLVAVAATAAPAIRALRVDPMVALRHE